MQFSNWILIFKTRIIIFFLNQNFVMNYTILLWLVRYNKTFFLNFFSHVFKIVINIKNIFILKYIFKKRLLRLKKNLLITLHSPMAYFLLPLGQRVLPPPIASQKTSAEERRNATQHLPRRKMEVNRLLLLPSI